MKEVKMENTNEETVTEFADRCKECGRYHGDILSRIANNHQISFRIEPLSYDTVGGVIIKLEIDNGDGTKSHMAKMISRDIIDNARYTDQLLIVSLMGMLDEMEVNKE